MLRLRHAASEMTAPWTAETQNLSHEFISKLPGWGRGKALRPIPSAAKGKQKKEGIKQH